MQCAWVPKLHAVESMTQRNNKQVHSFAVENFLTIMRIITIFRQIVATIHKENLSRFVKG